MATATEPTIEQRLAAAEAAIMEIRRRLPPASKLGWLEDLIGSQADEPAFDEVIALGRAFRMTEPPPLEDLS